jgi:hypothetical protein
MAEMTHNGQACVSATAIAVIAHPAERRRRVSGNPALAGPCCCCCCCCLHSLGGIVGAVMAPQAGRRQRSDDAMSDDWQPGAASRGLSAWEREGITAGAVGAIAPIDEPIRRPKPDQPIALPPGGMSGVKVFWITFASLNLISFLLAALVGGDAFAAWIVISFMAWPAFQLGAGAIAAGIVGASAQPDKRHQLRQIGRIVLGSILGAVIGLLVMVGLYFAFHPQEVDLIAVGWMMVGVVVAGLAMAGLVALSGYAENQ